MSRHRLSPLLEPRSVAVYGASQRAGTPGRMLAENLRAGGYKGTIGWVNPKHKKLFGEPCVASAADLPFVPDLALVAAPMSSAEAVLADCAARGTRFAVLHGIGTAGDEQREARSALRVKARELGVRLLGPQCTALLRPSLGLEASLAPSRARVGRVAFVSQSGAFVSAMLDWAAPAGIGFSSMVSLGAAIDLDFGELLDFYLFDHQTDSVMLYLEGVRDARGFMSSIRALSRVKPVVIMKAGRIGERPGVAAGDADAPAASLVRSSGAHSGALTGNDRVFEAAIARAGAVRAGTTMQFLAAAKLMALRKRTAGGRLAIVTNGAGPGLIAADALLDGQLSLARWSAPTLAALGKQLPAALAGANPLRLAADADGARIEAALRTVLADEAVDASLVLFVPQSATDSSEAARAVIAAAAGQPKPVAAVLAGGPSVAAGQKLLDEAAVPQFLTPENAVDALALLEAFNRNQQKLRQAPMAIDEGFQPDVDAAQALYRQVLGEGRTLLNELESKELLRAFGIGAPPAAVAVDPEQAAEAAAAMGFPVVLKILSPDIVHKSDVGGVRINVQSRAAARAAAEDILESTARLRPDARISGIVVQPMIRSRHQRELYLGMATDPMFGAVIAFGAGGVAVEQIDDVAIGLPPLNALLVRSLIERPRIARVLGAYRNVPGVDFSGLEQAAVRFSTLVCACPWIASIDINPLVADEYRVMALDARVEVKTPAQMLKVLWKGAYGHLAIHPYPRELEETVTLRTGATVLIRPIRPEDAELEREFVAALSPQTLYRRFMMPVKELSPAMIERFTQIDYDRELALIVLTNDTGGSPGAAGSRISAVARIIPTWEDGVAEFAIVVGDWMQHTGLGGRLMQRLFDAGRARGYRTIEGIVLGENVSMLRFCESLGFTIRINPEDPAERIARRSLE